MKSISIEELFKISNINIVDVREEDEFKKKHVPGAKNIPMIGLMHNAEHFLDKSKTYYIICQSGNRSQITCQDLASKGYNVINVLGGTSAYQSNK